MIDENKFVEIKDLLAALDPSEAISICVVAIRAALNGINKYMPEHLLKVKKHILEAIDNHGKEINS
jgi:hypothetical protein